MIEKPATVHPSKQPRRPHHIVDWAEKFGLWLTKFFQDRSRDEIERIKNTLEAAFPRKRA